MIEIFKSSVINAPVEDVWVKIRDFNKLPDWHPAIVMSFIENEESSDKVGCIRNCDLKDGGNFREQLLALSDIVHLCTYSILETPLPLQNYVATLRLLPITDGNRSYIEWVAKFDCAPETERDLVETLGEGVFQAGFDALKSSLEK